MCTYADTLSVPVLIPADLSHTGQARWKAAQIDRCIAPIVQALQAGGITMRSSCCGHGKGVGEILLQDGRRLRIDAIPASDRRDTAPHAQGVSGPLLSAVMTPNEPTPGGTSRPEGTC